MSNRRKNEGLAVVDASLEDLTGSANAPTNTTGGVVSSTVASAPSVPSLPLPPSSAAAAASATPPASSKGGNYHRLQQQKASPAMNTINSTASGDGYGSDSLPAHPPPVHPMFHSLHEDSDGSDGSIVFNNRRKKPPQKASHEPVVRGRERFPSFDSMASSGSLIRHGPQHYNNPPSSPKAPKVVSQQDLAKVNPQMLPYAERRKLMKMKEQQEQQNQPRQQQAQRQPSPPQPRRSPPDGRYMQYMMPPPDFQPNPYVLNGMPMPPAPHSPLMAAPHSPQGFMYPMHHPPSMQPQHMPPPMHMQMPLGAYPGPPNAQLSPYRSAPPPRFDPNRPPPPQAAMRQQQGNARVRPYPPQQIMPPNHMQQQFVQAPPSRRPSKPPSGMSRQQQQQQPMGAGARDPRLVPSSSLDSSEQDPPAARYNNINSNQLRNNPQTEPSNSSAPPPPPPPPPPNHVRTESTGSVSSLGSQGSLFGYFSGKQDEGGSRGGGSGFLQLLNPFSPKNPHKSPQQTASDFRRQNQEFLRQSAATTGRQTRQPSPQRQQQQRVGSMDRPPASRGTHKRLPSIENDNWEESDRHGIERVSSSDHSSRGNVSPSSNLSSSEETDDDRGLARAANNNEGANERTSLLPPPGQGSSEYPENSRNSRYSDSHPSNRRRQKQKSSRRNQRSQRAEVPSRNRESEVTVPWINTGTSSGILDSTNQNRRSSQGKQKKKKNRRRSRRRNALADDNSQSSDGSGRHSDSSSSYDYRQWTRRRAKMLEDERVRLIAQWKAEARAEALSSRRNREADQWHRRVGRYLDSEFGEFLGKAIKFLAFLEAFICNLPLTVGAIAMAIVTLGVVWFKFVEEILDSCEPVQFHSSQCTFPEFPGCFYCLTTDPIYKFAVNFHFACSAIAGVLVLSFVLKMLLATQVVLDEMSSPTTASPAGLICMTTVCVFAGRGFVGQVLVSVASCVHLCLVIWFIYMALAYHIMPDPSWYPNTVGIGMSAVKTWLYYPMSGHFLMAISLSLNFFFFPISLIRVVLNEKISATVGYMQMSAPAISLYALTIMAQPSFEQEKPDINRFQRAHRLVYLPAMHFLFVLSVIGLAASVQSLLVRWKTFKKREFSPAHAAFCFPTLSHANAIQAYRAAINSFSNVPKGSPWKMALDVYWVIVLVGGTVVTLWVTAKFFYNLPSWTSINVDDEEEPPAPYETTMTLQNIIATGESLVQPFVSPAVLQANETGALVMVRRGRDDGRQRFVRTRKLASLGFEPIMAWSEMERERELLLEWVGKHPPRRRTRTLSVPGIDFSYGPDFGVGNSGIYGLDVGSQDMRMGAPPRGRAQTNSPYQGDRAFF